VPGVAYGFMTAVGIGVGNVLATVASRRFGALMTSGITLALAWVTLLVFVGVWGIEFEMRGALILLLAGLGLAAGTSYVASFESLRLGPISVVSPIGATTGAATVVFAYLLVDERPSAVQWLSVPIATVGAVLASIVVEPGKGIKIVGMGPLFAVIGVITGAISNAVLLVPIREEGAMQAIVGQRTFTVIYIGLALLVASIVYRARGASLAEASSATSPVTPLPAWLEVASTRGRGIPLLVAIGVLDALSFIAFANGVLRAPAWLIGLISQSGRVITVVAGLLLFKERLRPSQWWGIVLVVVGLFMAVLG
jgi:drug/metabolite transporter (DMT)-like permease